MNLIRKLISVVYCVQKHETKPIHYQKYGYQYKEYMIYERKIYFSMWYTDNTHLIVDRTQLS